MLRKIIELMAIVLTMSTRHTATEPESCGGLLREVKVSHE